MSYNVHFVDDKGVFRAFEVTENEFNSLRTLAISCEERASLEYEVDEMSS